MIGIGKTFTGIFVASTALVVAVVVGSNYRTSGTFRTTDLVVDNTETIGGAAVGQASLTMQSTSTTQTTEAWFQTTGAGHIGNSGINEQIPIVVRNATVFDTTTLPGYSAGLDVVVSSSRGAGANALVNKALFVQASGGTTNLAIDVGAGTSNFQDVNMAGNTAVLGTATFTTSGTTSLADSAHDTTVGRKLTVNGTGSLVDAVVAVGNVRAGNGATTGLLRAQTQNGQDGVEIGYESGPKYWSVYPSTGSLKFFEYDTATGGAGKDRFFLDTGGGIESRNAAGNATVFSVDASGNEVVGGTCSIGGALNMNSHLINNVTDPGSAQDAATKNYVDTHAITASSLGNIFTGSGGDGTCTFDGVANPVCGASLSGSVYTLARSVEASSMSIATNVTINVNGWPIYCTGTITGVGTAKISGAGNPASGVTAGARSTNASGWIGGASANAGGAGGASGASAIGGSGQVQGNSINEWITCSTARGTSATSAGCGGGGGDGANLGGAGGANTQSGATRGPTNIVTLIDGRDRLSGNVLTAGAGGGGGGSSGGTCAGGGGGGGGAWVVVNTVKFAGSLTITVAGGNGANATAGTGTCGGGGGGAGGVIEMSYVTATGATLTVTAAKGTLGTAVGGVPGGNGFDGSVFRYNLSGDGT